MPTASTRIPAPGHPRPPALPRIGPAGAALGDASACFSEIYSRFASVTWLRARQLLNCDADADAVVQRVFMRLWQDQRTWKDRKLTSGFFAIAGRNEAITWMREWEPYQDLTSPLADRIPSPAVLPDEQAYRMELRHLIDQVVGTLPQKCQQVMVLLVQEGYSRAEAAEHLGVTVTSIEKQITRAYKYFRRSLREVVDVRVRT